MRTAPKSTRAFTIVELLVAAAITVVIVVLLGVMFTSLASTVSRSTQRIDAFRDARAGLQLITRDIASLYRASSAVHFVATTGTQFYSDPNNQTLKNHQLYFMSSLKNQPAGNPNPVPGDLCALGYYCRWDDNHYTLRRYFRDSAATFAAFKSVGIGNFVGADLLYTPADSDDVVASNVWDLEMILYQDDGTVDNTYPSAERIIPDTGNLSVTLPAAIEISFNAMSSEAARTADALLHSADDWMNPGSANYQKVVTPNAYPFRTRIDLR